MKTEINCLLDSLCGRVHLIIAKSKYKKTPYLIHEPMNNNPPFGKKIEDLVIAHLDDDRFGIPKLCKALGLSRMQVHRKIKKSTNLSTSIFIRNVRLEKSKTLLMETDKTVAEIATAVGFCAPAYFCRCFKKRYGVRPGEMRIN